MDNLTRHVLVARLVDAMQESGSWCGRTHIQKTLYTFQTLFPPPAELAQRFILYKHGPYSFELDEDLAAMEFYGAIERVEQPPYGPRYRTKEGATDSLVLRFGEGVDRWLPYLRFVAKRISSRTVRELEAICTLMHVSTDPEESQEHLTPEDRIARVHQLKPHLTNAELERAYDELVALQQEAQGSLQGVVGTSES